MTTFGKSGNWWKFKMATGRLLENLSFEPLVMVRVFWVHFYCYFLNSWSRSGAKVRSKVKLHYNKSWLYLFNSWRNIVWYEPVIIQNVHLFNVLFLSIYTLHTFPFKILFLSVRHIYIKIFRSNILLISRLSIFLRGVWVATTLITRTVAERCARKMLLVAATCLSTALFALYSTYTDTESHRSAQVYPGHPEQWEELECHPRSPTQSQWYWLTHQVVLGGLLLSTT